MYAMGWSIVATATFILLTFHGQYAWEQDSAFRKNIPNRCEIKEYQSLEEVISQEGDVQGNWHSPFIIRRLAQPWNATTNWQKHNLIQLYGSRYLKHGSEHSIVYGGGSAELTTTVDDYLTQLSKPGSTFVFQPSILEEIPQLKNDIIVPFIFNSWDFHQREMEGEMWHMLSLGPSRTGLPFHNHGKTWLSVIHGAKLWFLYPLGYGPSSAPNSSFLTAQNWFTKSYPQTEQYPTPPIDREDVCMDEQNADNPPPLHPYRPFICLQEAGDVIFVPTQWMHMTLNVGETIAFGGQELLNDEERLSNAKTAYTSNLRDAVVLKDFGLALMNIAGGLQDKCNQLKEQLLNHTQQGIIITANRSESLDTMQQIQQLSNDSFLLLSDSQRGDDHSEICTEVVHVSLSSIHSNWIELSTYLTERVPINTIAEIDATQHPDRVRLCVIAGAISPTTNADSSPHSQSSKNFSTIKDVKAFVDASMQRHQLDFGSLHLQSVQVRQLYNEAEEHLLKSLHQQPNQPEVIQIVSEMYMRNNDGSKLISLIEKADQIFTSWKSNGTYDSVTLASLFQKLGNYAAKVDQYHYAVSLLKKSIQCNKQYYLAWQDLVLTYASMQDRDKVTMLLTEMRQIFATPYYEQITLELNQSTQAAIMPHMTYNSIVP